MSFLRMHWFDLAIALAVVVGGFVVVTRPTGLSLLLWVSLIALFVHQFEEYRYPGYFPGMLNTVFLGSDKPDRYPLNTNTAFIVNVLIGWVGYFLAAVLADRVVWLGIATILVSVGNVVAHVLLFNIKGETIYNPGMATAVALFLPLAGYFFYVLLQTGTASIVDWILGVALGLALNYIGVLKVIDWLKDENTSYAFPPRCLLPRQRRWLAMG